MAAERRQRRGADNDLAVAIERAQPWLEAALAHGQDTHGWDDVLMAVATGKAQFWPGETAAIVTEILDHPRCRALHIWLAGGNMDELLQMLPDIERWATEQGCKSVTITGRRGWQRVLQDYQTGNVELFKEL